MYNIIAIAGKSGAGKDTILREVIAAAPDRLHEIVSCTTRPPREGEVDGVNYHFIDTGEFADKVCCNQMLEYASFNNWMYGTPISSLVEDKVNIGVFNPAGLRSLARSPQVNLAVIYIVANDKLRLLRQLNREENPNVKEIIRRFSADEEDFKDFERNDFMIIEVSNEYDFELSFAVDTIMNTADLVFGQNQLEDNE